MTLHIGPRTHILARSVQFMALGFAIGFGVGLWSFSYRPLTAAVFGLAVTVLVAVVVAIQVTITLSRRAPRGID